MTRISLLLFCLGLSVGAFGASSDDILLRNAYVRLAPPNAMTTAAFMVLKNSSDKTVKLVGASSPAAKRTELHTHLHENGMMRMRQLPVLEIEPRGEVLLAPGGHHLMLIELLAPLKEGGVVPVRLDFQDGSSKTVEIVTRSTNPGPTK